MRSWTPSMQYLGSELLLACCMKVRGNVVGKKSFSEPSAGVLAFSMGRPSLPAAIRFYSLSNS